jgi:hypothetical protein
MIEVKVAHVTNKPIIVFGVRGAKATGYRPMCKVVNLKYIRVDLENVTAGGENVTAGGEQVVA